MRAPGVDGAELEHPSAGLLRQARGPADERLAQPPAQRRGPLPGGRPGQRRALNAVATGHPSPPSLGVVAREWGRIGVTGFGGPPVHIALLRALVVAREGWMAPEDFEAAIAACNLLPGP